MFIKVTSSGNRRYAQLVESYRNEDGKPEFDTKPQISAIFGAPSQ